jgi:TniQ protein
MAVGVVPDHLPIAPRPVPGELCSSWLQRVAAANVLTLEDLLEALRSHPSHGSFDIGSLDYAPPPATCARLAVWCRVPEPEVRALDLQLAFPEASQDVFSQHTATHSLARFITPVMRPGLCPACLMEQIQVGVAMHVPAEWALACLTHCLQHRALLLPLCANCFRADVLDVSGEDTHRVPRCRFCGHGLPVLAARDHDPLDFLLPLQRTILACLRGQPPPLHWAGPCTARGFVQLIADLMGLVTSRDAADARVLADLLPNRTRWNDRTWRWRAHHRFATAHLADRLIILGAVSTILEHRDPHRSPRRDDPFALLWPALSTSQRHALATRARRWPTAMRSRLQHVARLMSPAPTRRSKI